MAISVRCPGCGVQHMTPDAWAGKQGNCKQCGATVTVPGGSDGTNAKDDSKIEGNNAANESRDKPMAYLTTGVVTVVVLAFGLNSYIRVPDGDGSSGIVEQGLFGGSTSESLLRSTRSENLRRFDESALLSRKVANIIEERGRRLTGDASLQGERLAAAKMAKRAYELSTQIPSTYLAPSNSDLPIVYRSCFVRAMELWKCGLETSNESLVAEGNGKYNAFLVWMQSKERSDFKSIR